MRIPPALEPLVDQGVIDAVVRPLMSGKEAQVFLVETRGELRVAKVYKEQQNRSFRQRADYTEGRRTRNSRDQRAMERGSKYGKEQVEEAWRSAEVDAIYKLKAAGVAVPTPFDFVENVLVMEMVADEQGQPAPRLVDIAPSQAEAEKLFEFLIREVVKMLCAGVVHGDLSDFNVLIGQKGPVIIDFPQVVDPTFNNNARKLLVRDVENLTRFLGRFSPGLLKKKYGQEMWEIYEKGELTPETHLTGNWQPQRGRANVYSLLEEIESLERESRARREALGLAPPRPARAPVVYEEPPPRPTKERGGGDDRPRKGRNRGGDGPQREFDDRPREPEMRAREPEARQPEPRFVEAPPARLPEPMVRPPETRPVEARPVDVRPAEQRPIEAWEGFKRAPQEKRGPGWGPPAPEPPPGGAAPQREDQQGGRISAPAEGIGARGFDRPAPGEPFNDYPPGRGDTDRGYTDRPDRQNFRDGRNDRFRNERPGNDRFRNEGPGNDRFRDERPGNDRFRDERPGNDRFRNERPGNDRFRDERPGNDRFRDERPGNDRFRDERPNNDRFRDERPGNDRFRDERPNNDRFRDERPGNDRFRDERPGNDRFRDERPGNDRFRDERPGGFRDERPRNDRFREGPPRQDGYRGEPNHGDRFHEDRPRNDRFRDEGPRYEGPRNDGPGEDRFRGPRGHDEGPPRDRFRGEPRNGDRFGGDNRGPSYSGNGYPNEGPHWQEERPRGGGPDRFRGGSDEGPPWRNDRLEPDRAGAFPPPDRASEPAAYSSDSPLGGPRRGQRGRGRHGGDNRSPVMDPRGPEVTHRPRRATREDERPESDEG